MRNAKLLETLNERMEILQKENEIINNNFSKKESEFIEKINKLEVQLSAYDRTNILFQQKQNKEYENQIMILNNHINQLNEKYNLEKSRINDLSTEVIVYYFKKGFETRIARRIRRCTKNL